ncbi:hypothetical protein ACFX2G_034992 [Malus domestica]
MLRVRVPTRAQVGFVGSALLSAEIHRLEVASSDEIAGNSLGACSPARCFSATRSTGLTNSILRRLKRGEMKKTAAPFDGIFSSNASLISPSTLYSVSSSPSLGEIES